MSKTTSMNIGEHFENLIAKWTQSGRFGSASEAMRAGLRLLEEHENKVEALQKALTEGEECGESTTPFNDVVAEAKAEIRGK